MGGRQTEVYYRTDVLGSAKRDATDVPCPACQGALGFTLQAAGASSNIISGVTVVPVRTVVLVGHHRRVPSASLRSNISQRL